MALQTPVTTAVTAAVTPATIASRLRGGTSGMKVSWHVTGIRKDPYANAHRIQIEEDKPDKERGYYMYPDLNGRAS